MITTLLLVSLAACGGATTETRTADDQAATAEAVRYDVPSGDLVAAIAGEHRSEENRARDRWRHPRETLELFGIRPDMTVVELSPGGGWFTEILAPYLRDGGKLVAGAPGGEGRRARYRRQFEEFVAAHPELYGRVELATFDPPSPIDLGADGSADMVVTFRNTHNWINDGAEREAYSAAFRVLKPGGVFGVEQHRAPEGADVRETAEDGYVPQAYVVEIAQAAGFVLEETSEINANPADDHDHPEGVWTLPPVLRLGEQDRDQWIAIGESDRMTLRFRKPGGADVAAPAAE